VSPQSSL